MITDKFYFQNLGKNCCWINELYKMRINFLLPFLELFYRNYFNSILTSHKNECIGKAELQQLQKQKFNTLIEFSKENVPYYRTKLSSLMISDISDLNKIPLLSKKDIQEHFDDLRAENLIKRRFRIDSTSGSSGETTKFYTDKRLNHIRYACAHRGDSWTGWRLGEPLVYLWGASKDTNKAKSFLSRIKNSCLLFNSTVLSSYKMTDKDMAEYVHTINKRKPALVVGYPSALDLFANYIKVNNCCIHKPKGIITGGETLYITQREKIEEAFQTKVLNRYGCREVGHIANECEEQNGLHISSDHVIVEIINEKGEQCKPGELGEVVVTDLDNYVFPLIRYRIGDLGVLSERICKCGRPFPMLESVEGRTFDLLIGTNGNRVLATFFTLYFRHNVKGILKFQIIQEHLTEVKLKVIVNEQYTDNEGEKIILAIRSKLGDETNVKIEVVDSIEPTGSGKHRWVISNVSPFNN